MKKKPSENRQQTEARILRAAEKTFATRGFSGSSMDSIASEAKLSKQNLIYYFPSKQELYRSVLKNVIDLWMEKLSLIEIPGASPRDVMATYVRQKLELSRDNPDASKVFAHEIINGAPMLKDYLLSDVKPKFVKDVAIVKGWIKKGLVKPISAEHLFFTIWASTQTYADFGTQISLLLGKPELGDTDFDKAYKVLEETILSPFFTDS